MGLLDDAIREHLDLKRRRGADPTEMEKLEREALGPVRRGADAPLDDPTELAEEDALYEDAAPEWSEPDLAEESLVPEPELSANEVSEAPAAAEPPAPPPAPAAGTILFDHEADAESPSPPAAPLAEEEHPTAENPAPAAATPPSAPAPPAPEPVAPESAHEPLGEDYLNEETAEYDVEAEHARERKPPEDHATGGAKDDDVLEETPEFLQDTPDHDRLWFEQRPPRDFDFDDK